MTRKQANELLPAKATQILSVDPTMLVTLLIAPPKWGKTTFFTDNPNSILFAFETGHRFRKAHKIEIVGWHDKTHDIEKDAEGVPHMMLTQALDAVEATDRYDYVIFDTVDMAAQMCMDYHCTKLGIEHPSDMAFGKGWEQAINKPMRKAISRMLKSGRGVGLITHTKNEIARFTAGEKARKESTMPAGVARFCVAQADMIVHGELGKTREGQKQRDRIMVTDGDADTLAGNRSGSTLPQRYIVDPLHPWQQFVKFFKVKGTSDKADEMYRRIYKK